MSKNETAKLADYYGINNQLVQLMEESSELIMAASKYIREPSIEHKENITEEIADVVVMIEQIKHLLNIYDSDIEDYAKDKVSRQFTRIRCELALHGKTQEEIDAIFNR